MIPEWQDPILDGCMLVVRPLYSPFLDISPPLLLYMGGSEFKTPIPYWAINNELFNMGTPLVYNLVSACDPIICVPFRPIQKAREVYCNTFQLMNDY